MESDDPVVLVGEISAPFGVRGEVKMRPLMDDPEALKDLPGVRLRFPGGSGREETRRINGVRLHKHDALLSFEGIETMDDAETLRGVKVFILRSQLPPLEEDAYYADDLVGLQVVTESGRDLGQIEQVHFYPANDVYETPVALIPAVEDIVVEVDLEAGRVLVRDIPGLRKDE